MQSGGEGMDIKLICREENKDLYTTMLIKAGFVISDTANLTFREDDYIRETFLGKDEEGITMIPYQDVVFIEAFGNDVFLHTAKKKYEIKERLYEAAGLYENRGLVRVNKSQIVNIKMIKEIRPQINSRFTLVMKNQHLVDVTRTYLLAFKEVVGI